MSEADCYAFQIDAHVARGLGASREHADALAAYAYAHRANPAEGNRYASSDCVPGGALDLHPETPAWPSS